MRLGCCRHADRIRAGCALALLSHENTPCRMGRVDSGAVSGARDRGSVLEPNQICSAISRDCGDRDLVHPTAGEAGISLSRIPFTKLPECSVPNSRAISIDSSMTTAAGVPMRVIS